MDADPSTKSNYSSLVILKASFDLKVDLENKVLHGSVVYDIRVQRVTDALILDIYHLEVHECKVDNEIVSAQVRKGDKLGDCLAIPVGDKKDDFKVSITYSTTESGTALQWLSKEMTRDGEQPFFFSQCQAIHARSLYPCQDTPAVKFTYAAKVHFPSAIDVVMAACRDGERVTCKEHPGCSVVQYQQNVPIPSYLFAIAGGLLASKRIGPRSTVWAEPSVVVEAAAEFVDCEHMLSTAESICGPYQWGVYDLLILPPSFPYGGMENPNLTFVTPTLLTGGERSLTNVIAHEITHSWTGNSVTNSSWAHFWLNEGHTTYIERLIIGKLQGATAREAAIVLGYKDLLETIRLFGQEHNFTRLVPDMKDVDPDEAFSKVPYEKGSLLLFYLETLVGTEKMLDWLKKYLHCFKQATLTTDVWLDFLKQNLLTEELTAKIDWEAWIERPGAPPFDPTQVIDNSLLQSCEHSCGGILDGSFANCEKKSGELVKLFDQLPITLKQCLLKNVFSASSPLSCDKLVALDGLLKLNTSPNAELRFLFSLLVCKAQSEAHLGSVFEFLNSMGRMKFVRPLYRSLNAWPAVRDRTVANFRNQQAKLHPTTARMVAADLKL